MPFSYSESEIRKALTVIKPNNALFEIRLIAGRWNASGYFRDADAFLAALQQIRIRPNTNVYLLLNEISDSCFSRTQRNRFVENASPTTSDGDVTLLRWLMVDLDPKRTSGVGSSDEQVELAHQKAQQIFQYLKNRGWEDPVIAMSGNGYHLLYSISLENSPGNQTLVKMVLQTLDMCFSDSAIDVDTSTFNPARICKLYGTLAQKGADTEDRPHRMAHIVYLPETIQQTSVSLLDDLTKMLPQEEAPQKYNNYNPRTFDVQEWIDGHGIRYKEKSPWQGGTKWVLEECPFNPEHKGKDASIVQTADGKLCFHCFHNSCSDKRWQDLRLLYEPDAYDRRKKYAAVPNYLQTMRERMQQGVFLEEGTPRFWTTEQIRNMEVPDMEFLPSGISELDRKMRGLKKGSVSLLSGLRSSGKSSLISQITLACRQGGYKVALYSGELTSKNLLDWLVLQAAGKANTHATAYEDFYLPDIGVEEAVSRWLDDWVYVYNNDYGNDFTTVIKDIDDCVTQHSVDLVILDNLMALNIKRLDYDKYAAQSEFVHELEVFAKEKNVHVLFVAHPRKAMGFLRLDDVSGSGDLANAVDNAFIVHRVNEDFKRLTQQMFRWKESNPLYTASNVIEICKDRDGGHQDEFISLFFEKETKRLRNNPTEYVHFGWETEYSGLLAAKPEYMGNTEPPELIEAPEADIPEEFEDEGEQEDLW